MTTLLNIAVVGVPSGAMRTIFIGNHVFVSIQNFTATKENAFLSRGVSRKATVSGGMVLFVGR